MNKALNALLDVAAALDVEVTEKDDIDSLKLKILAGIDYLDSTAQCRQKQNKKTARKACQWRVKAQRYDTRVPNAAI